jgi:hypothetical protein
MKAQRDYEEAEDLFRHGLALREDLLGVTHPETMDSVRFLGELLLETDRGEQAESLVRETAALPCSFYSKYSSCPTCNG